MARCRAALLLPTPFTVNWTNHHPPVPLFPRPSLPPFCLFACSITSIYSEWNPFRPALIPYPLPFPRSCPFLFSFSTCSDTLVLPSRHGDLQNGRLWHSCVVFFFLSSFFFSPPVVLVVKDKWRNIFFSRTPLPSLPRCSFRRITNCKEKDKASHLCPCVFVCLSICVYGQVHVHL